MADIGGKVSSLLGTFTLISGVLLPLSARQCIYVNSKYVLCSLCSYSLGTPVLGAQGQNADLCCNKVLFFWDFSASRPIGCTEICLVDVWLFAVLFSQFFSKRLTLNWETILQHARLGVPETEHYILKFLSTDCSCVLRPFYSIFIDAETTLTYSGAVIIPVFMHLRNLYDLD